MGKCVSTWNSCIQCGAPYRGQATRSGRCKSCIMTEPYDLIIQQDNCVFQVHTDLMTINQLKKVFKVFGKTATNVNKQGKG